MFPSIIFHSTRRLQRPQSLLPLLSQAPYILERPNFILPFKCTSISYYNGIINGHFPFPVWNVFKRHLFFKSTVFPYIYMKYGNTIVESNATSLTPYHIFSNGKWYKSSILLSHTLPSKSIYLLYSFSRNLMPIITPHHPF